MRLGPRASTVGSIAMRGMNAVEAGVWGTTLCGRTALCSAQLAPVSAHSAIAVAVAVFSKVQL